VHVLAKWDPRGERLYMGTNKGNLYVVNLDTTTVHFLFQTSSTF
jgi:hypothetical protein